MSKEHHNYFRTKKWYNWTVSFVRIGCLGCIKIILENYNFMCISHQDYRLSEENVKLLGKCYSVDVSDSRITDNQMKYLKDCIKLNLRNTEVSDKGIKDLEKCEVLDVRGTKVTPNVTIYLNLKSLRINNNYLNDQLLNIMSKYTVLDISKCAIKELEYFKCFKNFKGTRIYLDDCDFVTDSLLENFKNCHTVSICECKNITDEGLKHLSECHTVELEKCVQITDKGVKYLKKCYKLNLSGCTITDDSVKELINCKVLNFKTCKDLTIQSLKLLGRCKEIALPNNVTNDVLKYLVNCETLDLSGCMAITDYGIYDLSECKKLNLANLYITGSCFSALRKCEWLSLYFCREIYLDNFRYLTNVKYLDIRRVEYFNEHYFRYMQNCKTVLLHPNQERYVEYLKMLGIGVRF